MTRLSSPNSPLQLFPLKVGGAHSPEAELVIRVVMWDTRTGTETHSAVSLSSLSWSSPLTMICNIATKSINSTCSAADQSNAAAVWRSCLRSYAYKVLLWWCGNTHHTPHSGLTASLAHCGLETSSSSPSPICTFRERDENIKHRWTEQPQDYVINITGPLNIVTEEVKLVLLSMLTVKKIVFIFSFFFLKSW